MSTVSTENTVASDQNGSTNDTQKPLQVNPTSLISYSLLFEGFLLRGSARFDRGFAFPSPLGGIGFGMLMFLIRFPIDFPGHA